MKTSNLRQNVITALCIFLRLPFALLNVLSRAFNGRAWHDPRSIVVIKPCCIGDLVMTTPLLEVLQANYPQARITYVAGTWSKTVAEHHPAVASVVDCGAVGIPGRYRLFEYIQLARRLRSEHFDLAFVLDRSPMLTLLPWLAGATCRVGPDSLGRGFSLTDRVPVSASPDHLEHEVDIYLDLARALKLHMDHPRMRFVPTEGERSTIHRDERRQVAVFVGGGSNPGMDLTAKRWPLDRYRVIVDKLVRALNVQVLLIGGPDDAKLNQALLAELDLPEDSVIDLAGKTSIGQSAAQIEACALFIGNDSSPMHLAAAVGTPVIALFGPTSPQEYGPYPLDDPQHIALWHNPKGRPCFFLGKMQPCTDCTCMPSVTVEEVWAAIEQLIGYVQSKEAIL